MRKILETTISSCGVQVRNGPNNVFSEDRYGTLILCYLLGILFCYFYKTLYHRRVRETNCVVGDKQKAADKVIRNCPCTIADFEWYVFFHLMLIFK